MGLYIVLFLHQTTTEESICLPSWGCISFFSYIKPQLMPRSLMLRLVVYRSFPTSNHNLSAICFLGVELYIVFFLHQTTTSGVSWMLPQTLYIVLFLHQTTTFCKSTSHLSALYIVLFLHQTTTFHHLLYSIMRCISFFSYIKPQLKLCIMKESTSCISFFSYIKPQPYT